MNKGKSLPMLLALTSVWSMVIAVWMLGNAVGPAEFFSVVIGMIASGVALTIALGELL